MGNYERSFAITRFCNFEWSFAITQHAYISMYVLVSLTLFQSTNINTSLLQTGIKLYLQLYFTSALLLIFMRCSIKVNVQKSRQSHLPVFWKFSLQNLGKSPKSLHTTSEWMNSYCHRLFSLCPLFRKITFRPKSFCPILVCPKYFCPIWIWPITLCPI